MIYKVLYKVLYNIKMQSRCACTKKLSTFWPPQHRYEGKMLYGNKNNFCTMFYHVMPIWEYGIKEHTCLNEDAWKCSHKNITIILRIIDKDDNKTIKAIRYTNCIMMNRRPKHAEEFMVVDKSILLPNTKITIYTQLQPCHHSSGKDGTYDNRSCTELVINWYNKILKPLNIDLEFQCGAIYKAMWKDPTKYNKNSKNVYKSTSENARIGIKLLYDNDIKISMIKDWDFLFSHTENINIPIEKQKIKQYVDSCHENLLSSIKNGSL